MPELRSNLFEHIDATPKEHYTFQIDASALVPVEKKYVGRMTKRMIFALTPGLLLLILDLLWNYGFGGFGGFAIGVLFVSAVGHIKMISAYKKLCEKRNEACASTLYDYTLYDGFMIIWISSEDGIRQKKVKLGNIKKAQIIADVVVLEIDGELFLLKKEELEQGSYFLAICSKK
jgi:hypothetical protein